jgi:hypothetical protein
MFVPISPILELSLLAYFFRKVTDFSDPKSVSLEIL